MRIRLDTEHKTITVERTTNFGTFMRKIEAILPNGEWKEYDLHIDFMSNWDNVIYVNKDRWLQPQPNNPWQQWYSTSGVDPYGSDPGDEHQVKTTKYNIEI